MGVLNLEKGVNALISKSTKTATIGLGWDVSGNAKNFDLDASAFLLDENGKVSGAADVVYFGNKTHSSGSVWSTGDNLTGDGDGDDEQIKIEFDKVPANIKRIAIVVNIYDAANRGQNFGQVNNAFCRLVDTTDGKEEEQDRFDLTEDYSAFTGMHMVDIYRHNDDWKIKAIGEGVKGDLQAFFKKFGG